MKTRIFLFLWICSIQPTLFTQDFNELSTLLEIMEDSPVVYNLQILEEPIECPDRSDNLLYNDVYRIESGDGLSVHYYDSLSPEGQASFDRAEVHFQDRNIDSALFYYEFVLKSDPGYYKAMTYTAQMYGILGSLEMAEAWYKEAIRKNYVDYLAHWLLADIYRMQGNIDSAVHEITIASILNRNNPRLKTSMEALYKEARIRYADWCFSPQIKLEESDTGKVDIYFTEHWLPYALTKAVWEYEPGYKASKGVGRDEYTLNEEKECLLSLMTGLIGSDVKLKKYTEFRILNHAFEQQMLDEYILYEIMLPDYPAIAYQIPKPLILSIRDYVMQVRFLKK